MVPDAEARASALRNRGGKFPPEYFTKIATIFFDGPLLEVHAHPAARTRVSFTSDERNPTRTRCTARLRPKLRARARRSKRIAFCTSARSVASRAFTGP